MIAYDINIHWVRKKWSKESFALVPKVLPPVGSIEWSPNESTLLTFWLKCLNCRKEYLYLPDNFGSLNFAAIRTEIIPALGSGAEDCELGPAGAVSGRVWSTGGIWGAASERVASDTPLATRGASNCCWGVLSFSCLPLGRYGSAPGRIEALTFVLSTFVLVPPCSLTSCGGLSGLKLDGTPGHEIHK